MLASKAFKSSGFFFSIKNIPYSIWTAQVIGVFKAKAERVEIPYQTLLNTIVKRYTESMLDKKNDLNFQLLQICRSIF